MNIKLFIYMAIVVAEIICGYLGFREGVYVLKPLIMLSLIYWHLDYLKTHPLLWIGMWFGLGGDVFLMFSGTQMASAKNSDNGSEKNSERTAGETAEESKKESGKSAKSKGKKDESKDNSFLDKIVDAFRPKNGETQQ